MPIMVIDSDICDIVLQTPVLKICSGLNVNSFMRSLSSVLFWTTYFNFFSGFRYFHSYSQDYHSDLVRLFVSIKSFRSGALTV